VEGSDNNPIKLPETPLVEIENLLRFFYFGMHDDYVASLSDWIAILSISTRLMFEKVHERAIKEITALLDQVEAFELIGLAIKYDVEQWLKAAYRKVVTRVSLITHAEAAKVPFPMAVMLMRSREQYWRNNMNNCQGTTFGQGAFRQSAFRQSPSGQGVFRQSSPGSSPDPIIDSEIRLMVPEPTEGTRARVRREPMASTATRGSRAVEAT